MARKGIGVFCLIIAVVHFFVIIIAAPQGMDVTGAGVAAAIYLVIGLALFFKKIAPEVEKTALNLRKEEAKEQNIRMLIKVKIGSFLSRGCADMARKSMGVFCLIIAAAGFFVTIAAPQGMDVIGASVAAAIYLVIGLALFFKKGKSEEEKAALKARKKAVKERNNRMLVAEHVAGLPLVQSATCTISFEDACITVCGSGNTFNLNYSKVTDMDIKTSVEIQKAYVSSAGGAVAGAVLFGPLGAMVGGRTREKRSKTVENFLIFTYLKDGNIDYLSFKLSETYKAMKLIGQCKPRIAQQGIVTEL